MRNFWLKKDCIVTFKWSFGGTEIFISIDFFYKNIHIEDSIKLWFQELEWDYNAF